jgi:septal ring factor EnvC (AmiA/AmiB activator)
MTGPVGWLLAAGIGGLQLHKGKKELNRTILSMIIWYSLSHYQGQVVPWDEDLPSWANDEEREMIEALDRKVRELLEEKDSLEKKINRSTQRLEKLKESKIRISSRMQKEIEKCKVKTMEKQDLEAGLNNESRRSKNGDCKFRGENERRVSTPGRSVTQGGGSSLE